MKTLLINREPRNHCWGGGNNFVRAICDHGEENGFRVTHKLEPKLDAILMVDPRMDELGIDVRTIWDYMRENSETKLVHRLNECDQRKGTKEMDELLRSCSVISDASIFVSNWMRSYFLEDGCCPGQRWACDNTSVIYNGVDREIFKPGEKFDNGKINIVVHHWSNNNFKNHFTRQLDTFVGDHDDFSFTYIGRAPEGLKNTKIIDPLFGEALGKELGRYDVCINSSLWDPAPNSVLETLACDIPIYCCEEGGGSRELVGQSHIYSNWEELEKLLLSKQFLPNIEGVKLISWKQSVKEYCDAICEVCNAN